MKLHRGVSRKQNENTKIKNRDSAKIIAKEENSSFCSNPERFDVDAKILVTVKHINTISSS